MFKLYGKPLTSKNIKKLSLKIVNNKYFTYFFAVVTLLFVSETLNNPDNEVLLSLKAVFNNILLKLLVLLAAVLIGFYNQTLGILLVINFFFLINIHEKMEFFANNLPNLVDKNTVLKYKKNIRDRSKPEPKRSKKKNIEEDKVKLVNKKKKTNPDAIKNPIKIKASEKIAEDIEETKEIEDNIKEEVDTITDKIDNEEIETDDMEIESGEDEIVKKKKKLYQKYYKSHKKNKSKIPDDIGFAERGNPKIEGKKTLQEHIKRKTKNNNNKEKLIDELKQVEEEQVEEDRLRKSKDETLETQIKKKNIEKRRNLKILEEDDDDSSSSESSGSSSSESSSDSDKEYEDVSLTEAREHVLKKLRNKMKKDYVNNK